MDSLQLRGSREAAIPVRTFVALCGRDLAASISLVSDSIALDPRTRHSSPIAQSRRCYAVRNDVGLSLFQITLS